MFQIWFVLEHDPDLEQMFQIRFSFLLPGEFIWGEGNFFLLFSYSISIG